MTSLPLITGAIALCWIADGFSNPRESIIIQPEKNQSCRLRINVNNGARSLQVKVTFARTISVNSS